MPTTYAASRWPLPHVEEIDSDGFGFRVAGGFVWSYPERRRGRLRPKPAPCLHCSDRSTGVCRTCHSSER